MQQLAAQGVSETHDIINRMMGCGPDLHKIWVGTSDQQLMALSREFPGFYHYACIGNGCPTWMPSKTRCAHREQNPRCWNT